MRNPYNLIWIEYMKKNDNPCLIAAKLGSIIYLLFSSESDKIDVVTKLTQPQPPNFPVKTYGVK